MIKTLCNKLQSFVRTMAIQEKEPPLVGITSKARYKESGESPSWRGFCMVLSDLHNPQAKEGCQRTYLWLSLGTLSCCFTFTISMIGVHHLPHPSLSHLFLVSLSLHHMSPLTASAVMWPHYSCYLTLLIASILFSHI